MTKGPLCLIVLSVQIKRLFVVLIVEVMPLSISAQAVSLPVLTKRCIMGKAIITFKLMPESVEVDLGPIKEQAEKIARDAGAIGEMQVKEEPIAFGLKAVLVLAMYEVEGADFDGTAAKMGEITNVQSSEVAKMDLALG